MTSVLEQLSNTFTQAKEAILTPAKSTLENIANKAIASGNYLKERTQDAFKKQPKYPTLLQAPSVITGGKSIGVPFGVGGLEEQLPLAGEKIREFGEKAAASVEKAPVSPIGKFALPRLLRGGSTAIATPVELLGASKESLRKSRERGDTVPYKSIGELFFGLGLATPAGMAFSTATEQPEISSAVGKTFGKYEEVKDEVQDFFGIKNTEKGDAFELIADVATFWLFGKGLKKIKGKSTEVITTKKQKVTPSEVFDAYAEITTGEDRGVKPEVVNATQILLSENNKPLLREVLNTGFERNIPRPLFEKAKSLLNREISQVKKGRVGLTVEDVGSKALVPIEGNGFVIKPNDVKVPSKVEAKARVKLPETVNKFHGHTEILQKRLKKKGIPDSEINNIELENGIKIGDTVKIKREKNGALSAVITKDQLKRIKENFKGNNAKKTWVKKWSAENIKKQTQSLAEYYEVPQAFFGRNGLKKDIYDPIRDAERLFAIENDKYINRIEPQLRKLTKKESKQLGRYFISRQGRGFNVTFEDLNPKQQQVVETFDQIISELEPGTFRTAAQNGTNLDKIDNYAPIMTKSDIKILEDRHNLDFIVRKHPSFGSLKKRVENVPKELYETDYRDVIPKWIEASTRFNNLGRVTPQIKYLIDSDQFKEIVGPDTHKAVNDWLKNITSPAPLTQVEKISRSARKATARAFLGLNYSPVIKQSLTQIPALIMEGAPPKLRSKLAKDLGIDTGKMASILERKGSIAISDMNSKIDKIFTGGLQYLDKKNAQLTLNSLLDKELSKIVKKGEPIDNKLLAETLRTVQDKLDLLYGGMTPAQIPKAFRTETGRALNMFIGPLTSLLNFFIQNIAKSRGFKRLGQASGAVASVITIAYMEQVVSNLSFKWDDEAGMAKDVTKSVAGNIPLLGALVYALSTGKEYQPSALTSNLSSGLTTLHQWMGGEKSFGDVAFRFGEIAGLPTQIRKTAEGIKIVKEGGIRDSAGKLLAPLTGADEKIRTLLKGKYGSLAAKDWVRNIGKKSENRKWNIPQVEFLQNGDYARKVMIYNSLPESEKKELTDMLTQSQKDKLDRYKFAKDNPTATPEEIGKFLQNEGVKVKKDGSASNAQVESHQKKVQEFGGQEEVESPSNKVDALLENEQFINLTSEGKKEVLTKAYTQGKLTKDQLQQIVNKLNE